MKWLDAAKGAGSMPTSPSSSDLGCPLNVAFGEQGSGGSKPSLAQETSDPANQDGGLADGARLQYVTCLRFAKIMLVFH